MLKIGRKYNIGYDAIVARKDQRRKMPLWHHVGVLDNHSWNKKLASCLRLTQKVKTVGNLKDYLKKDSRHWHCKRLAQTIMNKIPQQLHPLKLEIEDNLDFTPKRLRMEKERNDKIQDTIDPNTIDNRSPEKAIHIFGSYKRYKNKKEKKESRLLRTPVKIKVNRPPKKIDIYYTVLEPGTEDNRAWYLGAIRTITDKTDETKTYCISLNSSKETADILVIIEALKIRGDIHIKIDRIETMTDIKLNIKRWEHKVGTWFLKIRGWENRAHCKCGELKTMNHIIMECPLNQGSAIWDYMKSEWKQIFPKTQWLQPTIELIRELGSIQLRKSPKWISEAYIERITEAIWLIWTIRNN